MGKMEMERGSFIGIDWKKKMGSLTRISMSYVALLYSILYLMSLFEKDTGDGQMPDPAAAK